MLNDWQIKLLEIELKIQTKFIWFNFIFMQLEKQRGPLRGKFKYFVNDYYDENK